MAKIVSFKYQPPASFSFMEEKGYNIVPGAIIRKYYSSVIEGCDVDPFIIKHYNTNGEIVFTIDDGIVVPTTEEEELTLQQQGLSSLIGILQNHNCDISELAERKRKLSIATDQANNDASFFLHKKKIYQRHTDSGYDIITLKCGDNGCISCGWYDYSKTDKLGLKMSAFMLYALGFVNSESEDEDKQAFWQACRNVLRHSSELDSKEADRIITEGIKELILHPAPIVFESADLW